ncbi:MAG TPA: carboxymuconolactone decarboxylase family protein [Rhodanobacteraceae bacterium]
MAALSIQQRLDIPKVDGNVYATMTAMEKYIHAGTLGNALIDLVNLRASQLNGCAFCLAMHSDEARKAGVGQRRLDTLSAWREAPGLYSAREQAAFAFTEEVTKIGKEGVTDGTWAKVSAEFNEGEIVHLLMAICAINVWNRMAISVHMDLPREGQ